MYASLAVVVLLSASFLQQKPVTETVVVPKAAAAKADEEPARLVAKKKVVSRSSNNMVCNADFDTTWSVLTDSLVAIDWRFQTIDRQSGLIVTQPSGFVGAYSGQVNELVAKVSTKAVSPMSTWQSIAADLRIRVKSQDSGTSVDVLSSIRAYNRFSGMWEQLVSNGFIESVILDEVAKRIPEREWTEVKLATPKPDHEVVRTAREAIVALRKVGAALELGLGREQVESRLVDALALIGSIPPPGPESLTAQLRAAAGLYRKALDGGDPAPLLKDASARLATAADRTDKYEKDGLPDPQPLKRIDP